MSTEALTTVTLTPLPTIARRVELDEAVRAAFVEMCTEIHRQAVARSQQWSTHAVTPPAAMTPQELERAFRYLAIGDGGSADTWPTMPRQFSWGYDEKSDPLQKFIRHPGLPPAALIRVLCFTSQCQLHAHRWQFSYKFEELVRDYWKHHDVGMPLGLRELALVFQAGGLPPETIGYCRLLLGVWSPTFLWSADATWPYFAERPELLAQALELAPSPASEDQWLWKYQRSKRRRAAFDVLDLFPRLPEQFTEPCWEAALGTAKAERPWAQKTLARVPDRFERIVASLKCGKQEARAAAAEWLARLGDHHAVEPLRTAFGKEKYEVPKGAIMAALERLGVPVDEFLDRAGLLPEAEQGLAKGIPADLEWLPFDQLPAVHWQDSGEAVPPQVIRFWLVRAHKLKSPEPTVLLRRYAQLMRPDEAAELGLFLLSAWITFDTRLPTQVQATQKAQHYVQSWNLTQQQALQMVLSSPLGSAVAQKGVLAVAGALCDARAAIMVRDFLKQWYGYRPAQCKALVQMVAWIDDPTAIQLLLATARRFRTAGIRKEAERSVKLLAERRDWTIAELADRSVSTCGLEDGRLMLEYGARTFSARLDDNLTFALFDADGQSINALPDARKGEDEELVKKVKKRFSDAKKELKAVVKQQQERLHEAMCEQREWRFADWQAYLVQHPVVGKLCQRVIWAEVQDNNAVLTFRPLADGTFTGADDGAVRLGPDSLIRVTHEMLVSTELSAQWRSHVSDYEIAPLVEQFGKPVYRLTEGTKQSSEMREFTGHLVEAFKLRGRATKLGYVRSGSEDGGWFYRYHKRFPTLGIEALIEFSGNSLPEENRTVALTALYFQRTLSDEEARFSGALQARLQLADVPKILLSECWNDVRCIAEQGTGFDPDWERKVNR